MEAYIKIRQNLFYKITDGEVFSINTENRSFKNTVALPSGYVKDVTVITAEEYLNAKKSIGL